MHKIVTVLAPTFGKLILSSMLGPASGAVGGTLISMAANRFQDAKEARQGAKMIEGLGREIANDVVKALIGDGAKDEEVEIVALEMEQLLRDVSLASILVDASLNEAEISDKLKGIKKPVGLSERETGYLNLALKLGSVRLRMLAPTLAGYSLERDEVILSTLRALSNTYESVKENSVEIRNVCDTVLSGVEGLCCTNQAKDALPLTPYGLSLQAQ